MNKNLCLYMPAYTGVKSYYEMVDLAAEFGLKYVELLNFFEFETPNTEAALNLQEYAKQKGVSFPCFSVFINLVGNDAKENIETVKQYANIAKLLGCKMLHHTVANEFDNVQKVLPFTEEFFKKGVEAAQEIYDYCEPLGIKTVFEGQGYLFNGTKNYKRFLKIVNRDVGVLTDFGNIYLVGETADDFINLVKDKVTHVHIKDVVLTREKGAFGHKTLNGEYLHEVDVGQGIVNVSEGIKKLKTAGYNGLYSLEYTAPTKEKFKETLEYLNSII